MDTKNDTRKIPCYDKLQQRHRELLENPNKPVVSSNGIFTRYKNPILTGDHTPLEWRYDFDIKANPLGLERIGINSTFNPGAMKWKGNYVLAVRVEGNDRKSFFAIAESPNGVDNFKFWEKPIVLPQTEIPDTNVYDMRLTHHEDGWIYGVFCTERKDHNSPADTTAAIANAGIIRTKDLLSWERLPDLISNSGQQRNVVLHPEFVNEKYALYTRPQDGFIEVGKGGGIGLGYIKDMSNPVLEDEKIINHKVYHTIYEMKNGLGPAPIKTREGWLHLAHGVRNTAGGLRYTLYLFMTALNDISKITFQPAGYFMAPNYEETVGDVPNVLFGNGWIKNEDGTIYIYYASSDTRCHVAVSSIEKLLDYVKNSPQDKFTSGASVDNIIKQIEKNKSKK
ncbi:MULTISPECIES: glycosidase [Salegentibacter]|jgi:4-O-beta-D-mannosyl-D-glucose phosphorylase|uniref:4-O-beta-D-mannosyl-D-glucose phosphorylase n=1 Tax=Salegentibacter agarivorans TaxID=345907 RepID=A0A1I2M921_9FLAO|nr:MULTISPECIES: glycosidase [Salegentibacter]APS38170.1 glycosidase [Salegentibacter sp. T436]SFF86007.1 4-O-beta-D-mannosyl-D-glucose phosphorylase [Salegentibacter agarivorans]